jgi:hypothetical protein
MLSASGSVTTCRPIPGPGTRGLRMRVGRATSSTDGLNWTKCSSSDPLLTEGSEGDFDSVFVGWPAILTATLTTDTTSSSRPLSAAESSYFYSPRCFLLLPGVRNCGTQNRTSSIKSISC